MKHLNWLLLLNVFIVLLYLTIRLNTFDGISNEEWSIMTSIRLPKILMAMLLGAILSMGGVVYQRLLNNALADSYTLGVSSGAVLGAACALIFFSSAIFIPLMSAIFGLLILVIILTLSAWLDNGRLSITVILYGVLCSMALSGILYLLIIFNPTKIQSIALYMFGSMSGMNYNHVLISTVLCIGLFIYARYFKYELSVLELGDLKSRTIISHVKLHKLMALLVFTIPTALLIGYTGIIGWIGIIVPQMIQRKKSYTMYNHLYSSAIWGATLLMCCELVSAFMFYPIQIPVGITVMLFSLPLLFIMMVNKS